MNLFEQIFCFIKEEFDIIKLKSLFFGFSETHGAQKMGKVADDTKFNKGSLT